MNSILTIIIGTLFGMGVYCLLERTLFKLVLGLAFLSHAANLFIFVVGGITRFLPPLMGSAETMLTVGADPLPQALILTAIVIGLGVQAFLIVLLAQLYRTSRTDNVDAMTGELA